MDETKYILNAKNETRSFLVHDEDLKDVKKILKKNKIRVSHSETAFPASIFPEIHNVVVADSDEFSAVSESLDGLVLKYPKRRRL